MSSDWDGHSYTLLIGVLAGVEDVLGRCVGLSTVPQCPPQTRAALERAWQSLVTAAGELKDAKGRLELAKVRHDLG